MTWSYNNSPATVKRDEVRFLVGDTDHDSQMVTDEEITYAINTEGSAHLAASLIAKGFYTFDQNRISSLMIELLRVFAFIRRV